jgi:hypothetical protein
MIHKYHKIDREISKSYQSMDETDYWLIWGWPNKFIATLNRDWQSPIQFQLVFLGMFIHQLKTSLMILEGNNRILA